MQAWKFAAGLVLTATTASAGGIERTAQSPTILFEDGNLVEFSLGFVNPSVSGETTGNFAPFGPAGLESGDLAESYSNLGFAIKQDFSENLSFALIYDQPFGANTAYPTSPSYFASDATATLESNALTGILKYTTDSNISVYGVARYQTIRAEANIPFIPGGYSVSSDTNGAWGYTAGVAYEKPEIALRVALTYNSAIEHSNSVTEIGGVAPGPSTLSYETPQSLNLDFQTGIAADTLLFGSVRWVDWSELNLSPNSYTTTTTSALVSYPSDTFTYTLGVGRRFNETWSGAISITHEPSNDGFYTNLGPTNGRTALTVGATYKMDKIEVTGGVSYVMIGDAETTVSSAAGAAVASFTDNSAIGAGLRIRYRF
ncbi:OmpP1/FadL family transporter [Cognatishimia activa]|uniref:OmpP1/FadL family transporter n=1 Tax=Cognatishimia activa TaxID=1715691 RepID=UPI0022321B90|nr:hypothetical protein [Cognatishimia activa]UZD91963.1 hypothetical protein M0D42_04925 [Cognatishimia activa]